MLGGRLAARGAARPDAPRHRRPPRVSTSSRQRARRMRKAAPAARRPGRHPRPGPGSARPGAGRRAGDAGPGATTTTPGWRRWTWRRMPDDIAGAVRALVRYELALAGGRATYEAIKEMLQREVLDAQFAGMKRVLEAGDPEAMQAVKDMLADLNDLLAAHARGEDTTDRFADFMDKHGELFPEKPENVDELIDALARRQAAAERMMASLLARAARAARPADEPGDVRPRPGLADGPALGQPARAAARPRRAAPGADAAGWRAARATATPWRRSPTWPTSRRWSSSCPRPAGRDARRRRRGYPGASSSAAAAVRRHAGAARAGARAGAAGLRGPRRRRAAADPAGGSSAGRDAP